MIQEISSLFEILNAQTMPFHPHSDKASEQSIPTVNSMLAKIVKEDLGNWDLYIPVFYYLFFLDNKEGKSKL